MKQKSVVQGVDRKAAVGSGPGRLAPWLIAIAIVGLLVPISWPTHIGNDEAMWCYMGRVWVDHGMAPYSHSVENKTPGIFALHAASYALFGTTPKPLRLLAIVTVALGSLVVGAVARSLASSAAAPLAGVLAQLIFGLAFAWRFMEARYLAGTETFMVVLSALAFLVLVRACAAEGGARALPLFASGVLIGAAIAFKQVAIFTAAGLGLYFILNLRPRIELGRLARGAGLLTAGVVVATLLSILPLMKSGVTPAGYVDGAWLILFDSTSSSSFNQAPPDDAPQSGKEKLDKHRSKFIKTWTETPLALFLPPLLLLGFRRELLRRRPFVGLLVWASFDFVGANASGYFFGHQMRQVVPPLAILAAVLIAESVRSVPRLATRRYEIAVAVLVAAVCFPHRALTKGFELWQRTTPCRGCTVGQWIDNHAASDAYVWCADLGCNSVLAYSDRRSPARYFNSVLLDRPGAVEETVAALVERPPQYIITQGGWPGIPNRIRRHVDRRYRLETRRNGYGLLKLMTAGERRQIRRRTGGRRTGGRRTGGRTGGRR